MFIPFETPCSRACRRRGRVNGRRGRSGTTPNDTPLSIISYLRCLLIENTAMHASLQTSLRSFCMIIINRGRVKDRGRRRGKRERERARFALSRNRRFLRKKIGALSCYTNPEARRNEVSRMRKGKKRRHLPLLPSTTFVM